MKHVKFCSRSSPSDRGAWAYDVSKLSLSLSDPSNIPFALCRVKIILSSVQVAASDSQPIAAPGLRTERRTTKCANHFWSALGGCHEHCKSGAIGGLWQ